MKRSDQSPWHLIICKEFNLGRLRGIILHSLKIIKKLHLWIVSSHVRDIKSMYMMVELTTHDLIIYSPSYFLGNKIGNFIY